jgi:hypothetical protein
MVHLPQAEHGGERSEHTEQHQLRWQREPTQEVSREDISCSRTSEAEFLDKIQTKVLRVFLLAIHSFALRYLFLQPHATSSSFYSVLLYTVKEKGSPFPRADGNGHFYQIGCLCLLTCSV